MLIRLGGSLLMVLIGCVATGAGWMISRLGLIQTKRIEIVDRWHVRTRAWLLLNRIRRGDVSNGTRLLWCLTCLLLKLILRHLR